MGKIDFHAHAFPDDLAARAVAKLEADSPWNAIGDGTVRELMRSMDTADIDLSVVCTIATEPDQAKGILKWCEQIRGERIEPFPSVHPETKKAHKWVKRFAKAGFIGMKLHPMYQDFHFDDSRMDDIYAAACKHDLLVVAHCGRDIAFDDDDDRASPQRIRSVIDRFPEMRLVCTHMGGWRMWDEVEEHLLGQNVYLETSFSLGFLSADRTIDMIQRHGTDRVMLGSDWPWVAQSVSVGQVEDLGLDEATGEKVLHTNAAKLLGR
jgi:predicted TIM-barrel fold metal-dependent hydrolase